MAVSIRLRREGKKKQPFFRIVVADKRTPRDGRYLEQLGYYNPMARPEKLKLELSKVEEWIRKGAQPTEAVQALIRKARRETRDQSQSATAGL
ncbi:30S ribosomal protein S16 [Candidatus Methylacidithermus pantelleriae]|uniref:Small ribosomal subunit protein bS16 n=1 Tax=Candidatus Methylacidithermus pantelleriae TaxID=2744239 RepID=A0A8J2BWA5_9BACT|nr:30S ribosomal protein S16 [Candidatus Methylacidithermus pantelleriae]CAF0704436.1 30S ribosomal subunit protein S16 [Candidatus Methylacidithermus pantelleriae]